MADEARYPSPLLAVGWLHSVNDCLVNDGGTVICTSGMNKVIGITGHGAAALVKVQAGVKLSQLHEYLAERVRYFNIT